MDNLTPERRSENMRRIRAKDTSPEMVVRRLVHGLGRRYVLHSGKLPGRPDLILPKHRKVIFVHGCFWHRHEGCGEAHVPKTRRDYWKPKLENNQTRDARNQRLIRRMGWKLLVVWECQTADEAALARRLQRFLTHRTRTA